MEITKVRKVRTLSLLRPPRQRIRLEKQIYLL